MKYACPKCGANVSFIPGTEDFYCEYCGSRSNIEEFENDKNKKEANYKLKETNEKNVSFSEYVCSTCGAKLITDESTVITDCVYCGSRQIMKEKLLKSFILDGIIPFKIEKNEFIIRLSKFLKNRGFLPKKFMEATNFTEIKGIYIPYKIFKYDIDLYARGKADTKTRDTSTMTFFELDSSFKLIVPQDTSEKFDDRNMTLLAPYDFSESVEFNPIFLNGFLAEAGNENLEIIEKKAEEQGIKEIKDYIENKVKEDRFIKGIFKLNFNKIEEKNFLLPVWFLNTTYKNKKYSIIMNGQTGKIVDNMPSTLIKNLIIIFIAFAIILPLMIFIINSDVTLISGFILALGFLTLFTLPSVFVFKILKSDKKQNEEYQKSKKSKFLFEDSIKIYDVIERKFVKYFGINYISKFGNQELETFNKIIQRNVNNK